MDKSIHISSEAFEEAERYLMGQMAAEERQVFEKKLFTDVMLQDRVKQVKLIITGIQEVSLSASLNRFHQDMTASIKNKKSGKVILIRKWLIAASVFVILAIAGWTLLFKKSPEEKLFATYFKPDPGLISAMSTTDNYVFDKAMIDYKTGKYNEAITAWKSLQQNDRINDTLNYFIGASYLATDNTKEAIPYLQNVTQLAGSYFVKDAYWYLALALLKEGKMNEAAVLISRSEHPQKQALLQQLKQASK